MVPGLKKPSYLGKIRMLLVTWKTGKSLLAHDPFSLVSFLTVILSEPDHSVLDGKNSLLPEMQGLR